MSASYERVGGTEVLGWLLLGSSLTLVIIIIIFIIIIITRPKPDYGRQGLAGSWGQDTDEVRTFLVFFTSHFAPAALSSDLNQPGDTKSMKNQPGTMKAHENQPGTMKTYKEP